MRLLKPENAVFIAPQTGRCNMGVVVINCVASGKVVSTGIEIERATFEALPDIRAQLRCPACGGLHLWSKSDAWLSDEGEEYKSD
jgi:hypothetical protein